MKPRKFIRYSGALWLVSAMVLAQAADTPDQPNTANKSLSDSGTNSISTSTNQASLMYKPRSTGLRRQVNAGSRFAEAPRVRIAVLAPEDLGLVATRRPKLWWYLAEPSTNQVEFTLNRPFKTLVKRELPNAGTPGLHSIDLAQLNPAGPIRLEPGVHYQWTIRLKIGDDPAVQPVSIGWLEFVAPAPELAKQLTDSPSTDRPKLYASQGYWYDALNQLAETLLQPKTDAIATAQLRSMLDQAGLSEVRLPGASVQARALPAVQH